MSGCVVLAYSGTHGTGKTTAVYHAAASAKLRYPTKRIEILCENASRCPYPINREAGADAQMWIFAQQIAGELKAAARCDILICDRTCVDAIAYTFAAGLKDLATAQIEIARRHIGFYRRIIFRRLSTNQHCHADGVRDAHDAAWRERVEDHMLHLYGVLLGARAASKARFVVV